MSRYNFDEIIDRKNTHSMNVEGWKSYLFGDDRDVALPCADEDMIRMWVADMEFAVAPEILDAIRGRVDRRILGYSGIFNDDYYDAVAKWYHDRYKWSFKKEELVFSPGIVPALYQLIGELVGEEEKVITLTPSYGFFLHACRYNHVELVSSPLVRTTHGFEIDFEDLAAKASDPQVKVLLLCSPHNPTGRTWYENELRQIADIAVKHHLWIISDEIHCDLLRSGKKHIPLGKLMPAYTRLITCMSASKTFNLAGLQFSHIIIRDPSLRKSFLHKNKVTGGINPLSVVAHQAAYEEGWSWLKELRTYLDANLKFTERVLNQHLPQAKFTIPEATYFAWIDLSEVLAEKTDLSSPERSDIDLPLFFAENAGVLLEGGDRLFVDNAQGCIRLNMAMPRSLVREGLTRIVAALK